MKETELAGKVVDYLRLDGWTVYQEVQMYGYASRVADIVATQRFGQTELIWIIECKCSMTTSVCEQAWYWNQHWASHYVSIAIPNLRRSKGFYYLYETLKNHGIGILEVTNHNQHWMNKDKDLPPSFVSEDLRPQLFRTHQDYRRRTLDKLHELHKTYAPAGNADGKKLTAFNYTVSELEKAVRQSPGKTMDEILRYTDHHYSSAASAKASIFKWIHRGVIKNIRLVKEGRVTRLYPKEETT